MSVPTIVDSATDTVEQYVAAFRMHEGQILNGSNAAVQGIRRAAIERFEALGLPRPKDEAWKYTPIARYLNRGYQLFLGQPETEVTAQDVENLLVPDLDAHVIVLVNGRYEASLSSVGTLPEGVIVTNLARAAEAHAEVFNAHFGTYADFEHEALVALNTAFVQDGLFIYVPKDTAVEKPVHLVSIIAAEEDLLVQPRHLIIAETGSAVKLVQTGRALGETKTFINTVTEVAVGRNAHVDLYEVQDDEPLVAQVNGVHTHQDDDSVFRTSFFTFGGEVVRNNVNIVADGRNDESHMYGLFLGTGDSHIDNHTFMDHAQPDCFSNELFKGILAGKSTGVFNGKIMVRQDAQRINAYQSNKSVVLSDSAAMYSKPELEIYADDVKCSHGATTGQLDKEGIFYLRSRGLSEQQARGLMLTAFARDVVDTVDIEPLREWLDGRLQDFFRRA